MSTPTPAALAKLNAAQLAAQRQAALNARRARLRKAGVVPILTRAELAAAAQRSDAR